MKYKDPGCATISIVIGNQLIHRARLDLGASATLIPFTEYERFGLGELKPTKMVIQLADRLTTLPRGIVKDVLIRVGEFIYPVDFIVTEIEKVSNLASQVPVILGHPFLATTNALINCRNETMRLPFGNMTIELNVFNIQRQPSGLDDMDFSTLNWVEDSVFDDALDDMFAAEYESFLVDDEPKYDVFEFDDLCSTANCLLTDVSKSMHESISPPALELKPLPNSFKYAFLGPDESLPVIITSDLDRDQEDKLIALLRENKEALGWTLGDIKGISPFIVQHRIHLEDNAKLHRGHQRCLNPTLQEVARKEVSKWLDHGIIYLIFDSEWVSPVQADPKKTGITVIRNDKNEFVPTRVEAGWRVCIDYRKLNAATRKTISPSLSFSKCWRGWLHIPSITFEMDILAITRSPLLLKIRRRLL